MFLLFNVFMIWWYDFYDDVVLKSLVVNNPYIVLNICAYLISMSWLWPKAANQHCHWTRHRAFTIHHRHHHHHDCPSPGVVWSASISFPNWGSPNVYIHMYMFMYMHLLNTWPSQVLKATTSKTIFTKSSSYCNCTNIMNACNMTIVVTIFDRRQW